MKNSKQDKKLDALLNKEVYMIFDNLGEVRGILGWNNFVPPEEGRMYSYYIQPKNQEKIYFRKSHVLYCREVKE